MSKWRAAQVAIVPESEVRMASSAASRSIDPHQVLRLDRVGVDRLQRGHLLSPIAHRRLRPSRKERSVVARRAAAAARPGLRSASPTSGTSVGDAVAGADRGRPRSARPCLAGLGQVLGVREVRPHHQQRVAALHRLLGGLGAEQPDPAEVSGWSSGTTALPGSVLTIGLPSRRRPRVPRRGRGARPRRRASRPLAALSTSAAAGGRRRAAGPEAARNIGAVGLIDRRRRPLRTVRVGLGDLDVVGDRQVGHRPPSQGVTDGQVDQRGQLRRHRGPSRCTRRHP